VALAHEPPIPDGVIALAGSPAPETVVEVFVNASKIVGQVGDEGLAVLTVVGVEHLGIVGAMAKPRIDRATQATPLLRADWRIGWFILGQRSGSARAAA